MGSRSIDRGDHFFIRLTLCLVTAVVVNFEERLTNIGEQDFGMYLATFEPDCKSAIRKMDSLKNGKRFGLDIAAAAHEQSLAGRAEI